MKLASLSQLSSSLLILLLGSTALLAETEVKIDPEKSFVHWTGSKVTGAHNGTVQVSSGTVLLDEDGVPKSGTFEIDLTTIKNKDIEDPEYKTKLENHLKSADFFEVNNFPKATFLLTDAKKIDSENVELTGTLSVKGISHEIQFPASIKQTDGHYHASGKLSFDRTKWDIRYNSAAFFDIKKLGDKLIYDDIEVELELLAPKS